MANTSRRTLRLLSLLQAHRYWPGDDHGPIGWTSRSAPCAATSTGSANWATRWSRSTVWTATTSWPRERHCRRW